jgi:hypothetical protein
MTTFQKSFKQMKILVTNTLVCFLHPIFLLSSFLTLDSNNIIHNMMRTMQKLIRLYKCTDFEAIQLTNLSSSYPEFGS